MDGDYFSIGVVAGSHGIMGDLKVFPLTDDINRFKTLKSVLIEKKEALISYPIEHTRIHQKYVLLKLKGIDSINDTLPLKGLYLKVERKDAISLSQDEYFIKDLIGLQVVTESGEKLGAITDVIVTGANDVYEVDGKIYIPAIKECILQIDIAAGMMQVVLLKGLRQE